MPITYNQSVRTARLQAVLDAIDSDVGPGSLEIGTAGMGTVLATIPLADPAGSISGDILTFDCSPAIEDASADATGTAAAALIKDNSGDVVISGLTVGTGGTNVVLTSTSIVATEGVSISSITITAGNT